MWLYRCGYTDVVTGVVTGVVTPSPRAPSRPPPARRSTKDGARGRRDRLSPSCRRAIADPQSRSPARRNARRRAAGSRRARTRLRGLRRPPAKLGRWLQDETTWPTPSTCQIREVVTGRDQVAYAVHLTRVKPCVKTWPRRPMSKWPPSTSTVKSRMKSSMPAAWLGR